MLGAPRKHQTWASQPNEAHFIVWQIRVLFTGKEGVGPTQTHLQWMSGRKKEWKGTKRQRAPPSEAKDKWKLAVWRTLLGEGKILGSMKAWICGDMSKETRVRYGDLFWVSGFTALLGTLLLQKGWRQSALIDRLTPTGCDIQARPLPGQQMEWIFKLTARVLLNFLPCFSSL